jgi:outer membrane protein OmpA-like peptidoglycan-associated protein
MNNKIKIIIAALGAATVAMAQPSRHEFSINVGGGLSALQSKSTAGSASLGLGGFAGAGYAFHFSEHWGIGTGVEAALFNGKYSLASLSDSYQSNDGEENFEYHYTMEGYSDRQQAILLNIPLMLRFQTGKFYAALGGKAGIPLSAKFNSSADRLDASGVYPPPALTLHDPAFMGFGKFTDLSHKGDLTLKTAFFASVEAGVRWQLSDRLALSTGIYLDYGLNSVRPSAAAPLIDYPASDQYQPNSMLTSTSAGKPLADKLNPIAAGIKIGLIFGASAKKTPKAAPEPDLSALEAERQRKAEEETRLAEQKRAEEQRLAEEQKSAEEQRLAEAKAKIQQPLVSYSADSYSVDGYSLNGTELSAQQKADLDEKARLLQLYYPNASIAIEGHTCNTGTREANLLIAQKRADVTKEYLVKKGIAAHRITTMSKAETEPLAPNDSEENKAKNRRVEIKLITN